LELGIDFDEQLDNLARVPRRARHGAIVGLLVAIAAGYYGTSYQESRAELVRLEAEAQDLQVKLDVIQGLDDARTGPLRLMEEVSSRTPERLWLTKLTTSGRRVVLSGESLDTGVVADFLRSLNESGFFENVDLESTSRGTAGQGVKVVAFTVTADIVRSLETDPAQGPA